jgi:hypothetical protein
MDPPQHHADPAGGLRAQEERVPQLGGAAPGLLRGRQCGRQNGDRGMPDMGEMRVVIVQGMRDRAVCQSRGPGRQALAAADDRRDGRAALPFHEVADDGAHRLIRTRQRHHHPVEERKLGQPPGPRRKSVPPGRSDRQQPIHASGKIHDIRPIHRDFGGPNSCPREAEDQIEPRMARSSESDKRSAARRRGYARCARPRHRAEDGTEERASSERQRP